MIFLELSRNLRSSLYAMCLYTKFVVELISIEIVFSMYFLLGDMILNHFSGRHALLKKIYSN